MELEESDGLISELEESVGLSDILFKLSDIDESLGFSIISELVKTVGISDILAVDKSLLFSIITELDKSL